MKNPNFQKPAVQHQYESAFSDALLNLFAEKQLRIKVQDDDACGK